MNADLADLKEKNIPSILPKGSTAWWKGKRLILIPALSLRH